MASLRPSERVQLAWLWPVSGIPSNHRAAGRIAGLQVGEFETEVCLLELASNSICGECPTRSESVGLHEVTREIAHGGAYS